MFSIGGYIFGGHLKKNACIHVKLTSMARSHGDLRQIVVSNPLTMGWGNTTCNGVFNYTPQDDQTTTFKVSTPTGKIVNTVKVPLCVPLYVV